jgi:hypothetical protein
MNFFSVFLSIALVGANVAVFSQGNVDTSFSEESHTSPTDAAIQPVISYGQISGHGCSGTVGKYVGDTLVFPLSSGTLIPAPTLGMAAATTQSGSNGSALQASVAGTYSVSYHFSGNILNPLLKGTNSGLNSQYQLYFQLAVDGPTPTPIAQTRQFWDAKVPAIGDGLHNKVPKDQQFIPITISGRGTVQLAAKDKLVLLITQADKTAKNPANFGSIDAIITAHLNQVQ